MSVRISSLYKFPIRCSSWLNVLLAFCHFCFVVVVVWFEIGIFPHWNCVYTHKLRTVPCMLVSFKNWISVGSSLIKFETLQMRQISKICLSIRQTKLIDDLKFYVSSTMKIMAFHRWSALNFCYTLLYNQLNHTVE